MNQDQWAGKWKQLRGHIRSQWGELTDDDLDRAGGNFDVLVGKIQEKYGASSGDEIRRLLTKMYEGAGS